MIIKDGRYIFGQIHKVRKGLWAFQMLIGRAGELRSYGYITVFAEDTA